MINVFEKMRKDINNGSIVISRKKDTVIQGIPVYDLQQI